MKFVSLFYFSGNTLLDRRSQVGVLQQRFFDRKFVLNGTFQKLHFDIHSNFLKRTPIVVKTSDHYNQMSLHLQAILDLKYQL